MKFLNLFKRSVKSDKSCKNCKYYKRDSFYDDLYKSDLYKSYPTLNISNSDDGHAYATCNHPQAKYKYISIERNTNWVNARMLGTCDRKGRRFKPNLEGLATILRQK